jgi:hypothetical protein
MEAGIWNTKTWMDGNYTNADIRKLSCEDMNWIQLAQNRVHLVVFGVSIIELQVLLLES